MQFGQTTTVFLDDEKPEINPIILIKTFNVIIKKRHFDDKKRVKLSQKKKSSKCDLTQFA
jgi:hypothetical protein